jgi:hypothetical protein
MNNQQEQEYFNPQERELITEMAMRLIASVATRCPLENIGEALMSEAFEKAKLFVKTQRIAL